MLSIIKIYLKQSLLLVVGVVLIAVIYPKFVQKEVIHDDTIIKKDSGEFLLFTKEQLKKFNGEDKNIPIYISILGSVYDVTKGKKHYGKGNSYNFFTGRDASVAFITGEFDVYTDKSDDILQLSPSELLSLYNWKTFYDKEYTYKGKLIGRFYDNKGFKTGYFQKADELVKQAQKNKDEEEKRKIEFPPCNIEWSESTGTKVWCTSSSGGIERKWSGVPRKYFEPGQKSFRCACINEKDINLPLLEPYENCDLKSDTCFYKV